MEKQEDLPHSDPFGCYEAAILYGIDSGEMESICDRYAREECHALTMALHDRHGWEVRVLEGENGEVLHSVAIMPTGILIDAYGAFRNLASISERYPDMENTRWRESNRAELAEIGIVDEDALEDADAVLDLEWMTLVVSEALQEKVCPSPA